jgi:hypothetical protein
LIHLEYSDSNGRRDVSIYSTGQRILKASTSTRPIRVTPDSFIELRANIDLLGTILLGKRILPGNLSSACMEPLKKMLKKILVRPM